MESLTSTAELFSPSYHDVARPRKSQDDFAERKNKKKNLLVAEKHTQTHKCREPLGGTWLFTRLLPKIEKKSNTLTPQ